MQTIQPFVHPMEAVSASTTMSFAPPAVVAKDTMSLPAKSASKGGKKEPSDKPKRPLSAYNLFFQHERAEILKTTPSKYDGKKPRRSHGKIGFGALARNVAAKWNAIDPETRKHFDELAAADKKRYQKEMEAWKAAQTALKKETPNPVTLGSMTSSMMMNNTMSCNPTAMNAQSIVKCNLMAASQASQDSSRMVFLKFTSPTGVTAAPNRSVPSARFLFQNLSGVANNGNAMTPHMRADNASAVVGQALALLDEDTTGSSSSSSVMPFQFQPLDEPTLQRVESEESSLASGSTGASSRRDSTASNPPHISELAAKLDDDCLGFMKGLLF